MEKYEKYIRYKTFPTPWCPGCGNGVILKAIAISFTEMDIDPNDIIVVAGIGCSGRLPTFFNTNTLHTTHGRALTFATGIKLARPEKTVVVISGDGDSLAIGGNHLIHASRRNIGIKMILINNGIYGMTGGQCSPVTPRDFFTETTPYGNIEPKFDVVDLVHGAGASFIARETVCKPLALKKMIKKSFEHDGFSIVEAISNCHVNMGRKNKMKDPITACNWINSKSISKKKWEALSEEDKKGMYPSGIRREDKEKMEYTDLYHNHIVPSAQSSIKRGKK